MSNEEDILSNPQNYMPPVAEPEKEIQDSFSDPEPEKEEFYGTDEQTTQSDDDNEPVEGEPDSQESEHDEYGNVKPKARMYTEEEMHQRANDIVEKRFQRLKKNNPEAHQILDNPAAQQAQTSTEDPDYYQKQLEDITRATLAKIIKEQDHARMAEQEEQANFKFQEKFQSGMDRLPDFKAVVENHPIDDPMTLALRGMTNPAAFIYAACKLHPDEIQRISKISDPYSKIVEMGKLEERMRRVKPISKAPPPISRTRNDAAPKAKEKDPAFEDLLVEEDSKRLAERRQRSSR